MDLPRSRPYSALLAVFFLAAIAVPFAATDWRTCLRENYYHLGARTPNESFTPFLGFRTALNEAYSHAKSDVLQEWHVRTAIRGREGWLFYGDRESLRSFGHSEPMSQASLKRIVNELERRRQWLEDRHIRYLVVFAPDKHTLYPEYMPAILHQAPGPSALDQLLDCASRNSKLDIVDLRLALLAAKQKQRLYYKTDTHWNAAGAYFGYRQIVNRLAGGYPGLKPMEWSDFQIGMENHEGDLTRILAGGKGRMEPELVLNPKRGWNWREDTARPKLSQIDQWKGVRPVAPTVNPLGSVGKLVAFHDSFYAEKLYPFLLQHFRSTVSVKTYGFDYELVAKEKPDVVIQEAVEREIGEIQ